MKKLLLLAFLMLPTAAAAETVSFFTEEYAPFNYRDGKVIKRYAPTNTPESLAGDIRAALG